MVLRNGKVVAEAVGVGRERSRGVAGREDGHGDEKGEHWLEHGYQEPVQVLRYFGSANGREPGQVNMNGHQKYNAARYMLDTKPRYMLHATIRPKTRYSYMLRAGRKTLTWEA